jgi:selenoprotein W-related protein
MKRNHKQKRRHNLKQSISSCTMVSLSFAIVVVLQLLISVRDTTGFVLAPSATLGAGNKAFRRQKGLTQIQQLSASSTSVSDTNTADDDKRYQVSIEYCTGCKWGLRSFWMAQELLMTFEDESGLAAVTLIPSRAKPGGVFRIKCHAGDTADTLLWDRKENDGFPKMKELKQLVRDHISPARFLGHSDTADRKEADEDGLATVTNTGDADTSATVTTVNNVADVESPPLSPSVVITYCTGCRWMLRAAYFGQELLSTFGDEINSFCLIPGRKDQSGIFTVTLDGHMLWDRKEEGGFPEITELKQRARDRLDPAKDLGHSDINKPEFIEEQDEEEAADARKFFGVM